MKANINQPVPIAWAECDTPMYKIARHGSGSVTDTELLVHLIHHKRIDEGVRISRQLLERVNNVRALGSLSVSEILAFGITGMTERMAASIKAAVEIGKRWATYHASSQRNKITTSRDIYEVLEGKLSDLTVEHFYIVTLNRANIVLKSHLISIGGITMTTADSRVILKHAITDGASSIILSHNHPSGNLAPSQSDIELTKKVKAGAAYLDISVLDHLIIANDSYYSFADEGML